MFGRTSKDTITVKDVPAQSFIVAYANYLKKANKIQLPKNSDFIKTGHLKELAPENPNWYYIRVGKPIFTQPLLPERSTSDHKSVSAD